MPVRTHANKVRSLDAWSEYLSINPKLPNCHGAQHLNERDSITDQIVRLKIMPNSDPAATIFFKILAGVPKNNCQQLYVSSGNHPGC